MITELQRIRESFEHGGNRGGEAEATLRALLRKYLPLLYHVGHGEVFNKDGRRSRQTDVVVANEEHPPLFSDWERANSFFIEAVAAGGEVKTSLQSLDALRDSFDKGRAFKNILAEPQHKQVIFVTQEDHQRFIYRRPYFAFFFESKVTLERIWQALQEWDTEAREIDRPAIDAVFILDRGSIVHFGNADGFLKIRLPDGTNGRGYHIQLDGDYGVLPNLLLWLFTSIPRIHVWTPPIVNYLVEEQSAGELALSDDGRLCRPLPARSNR